MYMRSAKDHTDLIILFAFPIFLFDGASLDWNVEVGSGLEDPRMAGRLIIARNARHSRSVLQSTHSL